MNFYYVLIFRHIKNPIYCCCNCEDKDDPFILGCLLLLSVLCLQRHHVSVGCLSSFSVIGVTGILYLEVHCFYT